MTRFHIVLLAGLIALTPVTGAMAQSRGAAPGQWRQDQAREESQEGRRISLSSATQIVERGRDGHRRDVTVQDQGGQLLYVFLWEYPGGRIERIVVDGRTGRIIQGGR
jgi:uncharacterized membrane protein YkoI